MSPPSDRYVLGRLEAARALLQRGWYQHGPAARLGGGTLVDPHHQHARAWSPIGALMRACDRGAWEGGDTPLACLRALRDGAELAKDVNGHAGLCRLIADWNDAEGRSQEQVLAAFTRAIEIVSSREAAA